MSKELNKASVEQAGGDERDLQAEGAQGDACAWLESLEGDAWADACEEIAASVKKMRQQADDEKVEREAFEAHESKERRLSPTDQQFWFRRGAIADYDLKSIDDAWKAWKARAALAQPSLQCKKCGGTGDADSGGIHPWGEAAMVPCDCAQLSHSPDREAFEAWAAKHRMPLHRDDVVTTYAARCTEECWQAWRACRAALAQPSPPPHPASELDFSRPLETENGDPVKWICADVIEYKSARVCVAKDTGLVYSSPYIGLKIRNVMPEQAEAERPEGERERFEVEMLELCLPIERDSHGAYVSDHVRHLWSGWELRATLAQPSPAGEYGDAYQGAREDIAIWKRRALEAEQALRQAHNGQTFMGEPLVQPYEAPREKVNALFKVLGFSGTASVGDILDAALERLQAQPSPALPPFAEKVLAKLRRFYDCASDFESGGVDIGRHWLDLLTQLGLLNRVQRSPALWEISQQGEDLLGMPQPSPAQAEAERPIVSFEKYMQVMYDRDENAKRLDAALAEVEADRDLVKIMQEQIDALRSSEEAASARVAELERTQNEICDLFMIGVNVRDHSTIMTNIRNTYRQTELKGQELSRWSKQ
ncbi:hypothetical protein ACM7KB_29520 [Pseudomonas aeruginosa]